MKNFFPKDEKNLFLDNMAAEKVSLNALAPAKNPGSKVTPFVNIFFTNLPALNKALVSIYCLGLMLFNVSYNNGLFILYLDGTISSPCNLYTKNSFSPRTVFSDLNNVRLSKSSKSFISISSKSLPFCFTKACCISSFFIFILLPFFNLTFSAHAVKPPVSPFFMPLLPNSIKSKVFLKI